MKGKKPGHSERFEVGNTVYFSCLPETIDPTAHGSVVFQDLVARASKGQEIYIVRRGLVRIVSGRGEHEHSAYVTVTDQLPSLPLGDQYKPPIPWVSHSELFTAMEVNDVLYGYNGDLGSDDRPLDEVIADQHANLELALALGYVATQRLEEEFYPHPNPPQLGSTDTFGSASVA